jgi:hypothetical protein
MKARLGQSAIWAILLIGTPGLAQTLIDDWTAQNSGDGEELLCKREVGGEYFFVARVADKLRLGDRLDMTNSTAFSIGWVFQNEKSKSLAVKVPPVAIKDKLVRSESKSFAENVQYQTVDLKDSSTMAVKVYIKKCPTSECEWGKPAIEGEKQYMLNLCEVPLKN